MFHGVTDVTIAPTGEIIVADAGSREIRLYDVEGRHIRTFGGLGDGPGEFRMVHRVQTLDDGRLAAMDPVLRRVTVLDLREGLIRVTGIGAEHPQPLLPYRMLKDSLFIAHRGSANPTIAKGIDRERNEVLLVDTEAVRRTVVAYRGNEIYVDGSRVFTPPLGTRTMVVVNSHSVALADTDAPRIELYDLNGSVKRTISWKQEPFSVTAQQREVMRDEYLQSTQREARREILAAVGLPERHPIISELLFDREDDLWVRGVDPDGMRGGVWKVFDVDGSLKSEVEIPGDLEVHEIGRDYVVGVRRDAVGVERVVVYSLRR